MNIPLKISEHHWEDNVLPLLSIVCITFNHEAYIRDALNSFLNQKTKFRVEILVHDDASGDNTANIIREYEERYPGIFKPVYQTENQYSKSGFDFSISELNRSVGKYIALCEGDDYWTDPMKLQRQVDFLELNSSFAGSAHQSMILHENGKTHHFHENVPGEITVKDIIGRRIIHTTSLVFHRRTLALINQAPRVLSGDRMLFFCIAIAGKFKYFNDCMCVYRLHGSGMSSTADISKLLLDLKIIPFLKRVSPSFPKYRYSSYVYASIGFCKNGTWYQRMYYLLLSFLLSFSHFPENLISISSFIKRRL